MNPLYINALKMLVRYGVIALAAWAGLNPDDAVTSDHLEKIGAAIMTLLTVAWAVRDLFRSRQKTLTALAQPEGTTEAELNAAIKAGKVASVTTPTFMPPVVALTNDPNRVNPR